ncbi:MAG: 4-alpha-glucanotransferase [Elusimicrobia bacterium RIFCSPLOWO2_01_FULL_64_13]|nr:MAG: 4-alpha-glucanotransferase [Elusimicrobia bacterium RIFCSPHIGHO2_01_FULL_64_10]OGR94555.1 MAG: 4-alpha-glucanotransferase [Elusimicrobia bacterium RIFCSPLOWO2_01_FULL_64_13]
MTAYPEFLTSRCAEQWRRIGPVRRAGAAVPLFSIHSKRSAGIGEIPDLKLLIDWCRSADLSVIQLLPMNDVGFTFQPYDAQSCFALDPMYLSLEDLAGIDPGEFSAELSALRSRYPAGRGRVDYAVKGAKLELLWRAFRSRDWSREPDLGEFIRAQESWLKDYCLYKVLKEIHHEKHWLDWEEGERRKTPEAMERVSRERLQSVRLHEWLQWQLFEQFRRVKAEAEAAGVLLMGDLPFLVSRDSADVWSNQSYFKLDLASGAPPDLYFANGQKWGMPPYDWDRIARDGYRYLKDKLAYAQNFYDFFRVDHAVGVFRIWVTPNEGTPAGGPIPGKFDPEDPGLWEEHGRRLLGVMSESTRMLACAEDLGTVPPCSGKVLREFSIPGMDVQRWFKDWTKTFDYLPPERYRKNSVAVISTHDTTTLRGWWRWEAGTVDELLMRNKIESRGMDWGEVRARLFDAEKSGHGRLRWKNALKKPEDLLRALGLKAEEAKDLIELFSGTFDEKKKFWKYLGLPGAVRDGGDPHFIRRSLEKACEASSILSIQMITDWLSLEESFSEDPWEFRINFPGTTADRNWTVTLPWSLEEMLTLGSTAVIRSIVEKSGRRG